MNEENVSADFHRTPNIQRDVVVDFKESFRYYPCLSVLLPVDQEVPAL
jgi:hypothetical protein